MSSSVFLLAPTYRVDLAALLALAPVQHGREGVGGDAVLLPHDAGEGLLGAEGGAHAGSLQPERPAVAGVVDKHHLDDKIDK